MDEEEILAGAAERIEQLRKADAVVRVVDGKGQPVPGVQVKAEQSRHAFLFGCNAFPVLSYDDPRREQAYQRQFAALFNYATLGFYWAAYEPEPGRTIAGHLERQARWCRDRGIDVKGHPLVWHEVYPEWGPRDVDETRARLRARVSHIVARFAGLVDRWDVVNEATVAASYENGVGYWARRDGPVTLVRDALNWANAANPEAVLLYNDAKLGPELAQLVEELLADHSPLHAIGIQSHMHRGEWPLHRAWETCESFARFARPLHFTEVTVLSGEPGWMRPAPWPSTPEGEARQADYVVRFYTALFSHPAVEAITWWDFLDGDWQDAPAGLVHADLTPKPVYERLLELVKDRWWTRAGGTTNARGEVSFRGFLGRYTVRVDSACAHLELRRDGDNAVTVSVA